MLGKNLALFICGLFALNALEAFKLNGLVNKRLDSKNSNKQITLPLYSNSDDGGTFSYGLSYATLISVGTPRQNFTVYIDMLTGDSFVAHTSCQDLKHKPCNIKNEFDNTISSTFKKLADNWNSSYGYASGFYGQDTVSFSSDQNLIEIPNSNFEFATYMGVEFIEFYYADGVFGLAFSKRATNKKSTVWENAFQQNVFDQSLFTITLDKNASLANEKVGQLTFGSLDDCKQETIQYFDLMKIRGFWQFEFNRTLFNGEPLSDKRVYNAIVDINADRIFVPISELKDIVDKTHGIFDFRFNAYTVQCSTNFTWSFQLGDKIIHMDSKDLLEESPLLGNYCILLFEENHKTMYDYVLGELFLKSYAAVFDYGNSRIGFGAPNI